MSKRLRIREWLNDNKALKAFIIIDAHDRSTDNYISMDIDVSIGDCTDIVTLDFSSYYGGNKDKSFSKKKLKKSRDKRIAKLELLIRELERLKFWIYDRYEEKIKECSR